MINPDCDTGLITVDPDDESKIAVSCACGWAEQGLTSRSKAKAAQREHRFPGDPPGPVIDRGPIVEPPAQLTPFDLPFTHPHTRSTR